MKEMTPFQYVEFYDVPRCIFLSYRGKLFLLQSAFDEGVDDYPDEYSVYMLPESVRHSLRRGSWEFLHNTATTCISRIPIHDVLFDPSKRNELDASILDKFVVAQA